MTLLFFALGALDLMDAIDQVFADQERRNIVEWVYSQQIVSRADSDGGEERPRRQHDLTDPWTS